MQIRWDENDGSGVDVGYHVDHATDQLTVVHSQPVDKIIRENQFRRRTEDNSARRRSGLLYEIANIPDIIVLQWKAKYGVDVMNKAHMPWVLRLIASREYNAAVAVTDGNFMQAPERTTFIGARDRASHPLASNRAKMSGAGGLIDTGAWRQ